MAGMQYQLELQTARTPEADLLPLVNTILLNGNWDGPVDFDGQDADEYEAHPSRLWLWQLANSDANIQKTIVNHPGFLAACFVYGEVDAHNAEAYKAFVRQITRRNRRDVAQQLFGMSVEIDALDIPLFLRTLNKFPIGCRSRTTYQMLELCIDNPVVRKALPHIKAVDANVLRAAINLPSEVIKPRLLSLFFGQRNLVQEICFAIEYLAQPGDYRAVAQCQNRPQLDRWLNAMRERRRQERFPPPPFEIYPADRLQPILSRQEMEDLGVEFQNCLRNLVHRAATGETYYFVFDARAIVEICPQLQGWERFTARGPGNNRIPAATIDEIRDELHWIRHRNPCPQPVGASLSRVRRWIRARFMGEEVRRGRKDGLQRFRGWLEKWRRLLSRAGR